MPIALRDEHEQLRQSVSRWLADHCRRAELRAAVDGKDDPTAPGWESLRSQGWLGLHVAEPHGSGFGLLEACTVVEQAGHAVLPGAVLPTMWLAGLGSTPATGDLATGAATGTVAWRAGRLTGSRTDDGVTVSGTLRPVLAAASADWIAAPVDVAGGRQWWLLASDDVTVRALESLDLTRRVAEVTVTDVRLSADRRIEVDDARVDAVGGLLLAAEAAGIAAWCTATATAHARERVQFGHPIGHFQAVKHACADMLVSAEQAAAAVWDAAVAADTCDDPDQVLLAAEIATAVAPQAAFDNAKRCIQVLGGIGFTWEHDAQLYLRRATAVRALLGGPDVWRARIARRSAAGVRREHSLELPGEAQAVRARVRSELEPLRGLEGDELRRALAAAGLLAPWLPAPAGRGADALEELIIAQELAAAGVARPHLEVAAWALPTLLEHGTPEQQERWVQRSLLGELQWCQLFSEPGAGSDLAALSTSAQEVDGGFVVNGQKVWTTNAADADLGLLLARTSPDRPRHRGLSYFVLDMRSPGVDVRPLRELTGDAMFNEVFLTDVFVPADHLVGELHDGWAVARSTLAAERVVISAGTEYGGGLDSLYRAVGRSELLDARLGGLIAEAQTVALLGLRTTSRALTGSIGTEAAVRKLLGAEHEQRVLELGLDLLGADGTHLSGEDNETWVRGFLGGRCLTIAGGTSEVQRNVIAERILGLPRDVGY